MKDLQEEQMYRIEELADNLISAASQYQMIKELNSLKDPDNEEEIIYKNFLLSVLATFEDTSGYEH